MWIMICGPYTSGAATSRDRQENLERLNRAALEVFERGHVPVVGVNAALPMIDVAGPDRYDAIMMPMSLALAERCDGGLRVGGASAGADAEIARLEARGLPIFRSAEELPPP